MIVMKASRFVETSCTQLIPGSLQFDFAESLERLGTRIAFDEIAQLFLSLAPDFMSQMRDALDDGNSYKLESAAHLLKGSAAVLSARDVVRTAEVLESMGRNRQSVGAEPLFTELSRELHELTLALRETLNTSHSNIPN